MSAFRIQAVMALAEDFCLSLIMKATISTMATAMKPAPMFRDFHGLVTPVTAPNSAKAYGGTNDPMELPKKA